MFRFGTAEFLSLQCYFMYSLLLSPWLSCLVFWLFSWGAVLVCGVVRAPAVVSGSVVVEVVRWCVWPWRWREELCVVGEEEEL